MVCEFNLLMAVHYRYCDTDKAQIQVDFVRRGGAITILIKYANFV